MGSFMNPATRRLIPWVPDALSVSCEPEIHKTATRVPMTDSNLVRSARVCGH